MCLYVDIDECSSSPCSSDATCVDGVNNYTCGCAPGYTGLSCETGRSQRQSEHVFQMWCMNVCTEMSRSFFGRADSKCS